MKFSYSYIMFEYKVLGTLQASGLMKHRLDVAMLRYVSTAVISCIWRSIRVDTFTLSG